jgi:hypothetical protein
MTGHFVCGVDSPLNVIGVMERKENKILTAKLQFCNSRDV